MKPGSEMTGKTDIVHFPEQIPNGCREKGRSMKDFIDNRAEVNFYRNLGLYAEEMSVRILENLEDTPQKAFDSIDQKLHSWEESRVICESPIEELFFSEALFLSTNFIDIDYCDTPEIIPSEHTCVWMAAQQMVEGYKADFLFVIQCGGGKQVKLVVECDGHDFHEKTRQQAKYDKSRDRAMLAAGVRVLRFTGSEIYNDVKVCGEEVSNIIGELFEQKVVLPKWFQGKPE